MAITATVIATYLALKTTDKLTDSFFDKIRSFGKNNIFAKQSFEERLSVVIQTTAEQFSEKYPREEDKYNPFYESQKLFNKLLLHRIYLNEENPLLSKDFISDETFLGSTQDELDEFFEIFMSNVSKDDKLNELFIDENYKEASIKSEKNTEELKVEIKKLSNNKFSSERFVERITPIKNPQFRFNYKLRSTTFTGRDSELNELLEFVRSDTPFLWWAITGNGGAGKSRLALELRRAILEEGEFGCEFMQVQPSGQGNSWDYSKPNVFIVDYAARYSDDIFGRINDLATRKELSAPVRILLIEREVDGDWWSKHNNIFEIAESIYNNEPLKLQGLDEAGLIAIIREVIVAEKCLDEFEEEFLTSVIDSIDPQRRPLFAMFIGIALANGQQINGWNQDNLLDYQINRESQIINKKFPDCQGEIYEKHRNLLTLSTICYGLTLENLHFLFERKFEWLPSNIEFNEELYKNMSDFVDKNLETELVPLLPDILGEYFVLETLRDDKKYKFKYEKRVKEMIGIANTFSTIGVNFFVRRVLQDFPTHDCTLRLFLSISGKIFNNRGSYGRHILDLMRYVFKNDVNVLEILWGYSKSLYEEEVLDEPEKGFIDRPDRVYQNTTLMMVLKIDDIDSKMKYYSVIKNNTDIFTDNPLIISSS